MIVISCQMCNPCNNKIITSIQLRELELRNCPALTVSSLQSITRYDDQLIMRGDDKHQMIINDQLITINIKCSLDAAIDSSTSL